MKSVLARSFLTDGRGCNDRLAAFAARQPLIFIQFSPLLARPPAWSISLRRPPSGRRASNHRHQSVTGGAEAGEGGGEGAIVLRLPASTYWEKRRPRYDDSSESGGERASEGESIVVMRWRRTMRGPIGRSVERRRGETRGKSDKFRLDSQ